MTYLNTKFSQIPTVKKLNFSLFEKYNHLPCNVYEMH